MRRRIPAFTLCWLVCITASAQTAWSTNYLAPVISLLQAELPKTRAINFVCYGHSVPVVDALDAYPNLLHAVRFDRDVLALKLDVVTLDYALNDRRIGLERARTNWVTMITQAQTTGARVILLTPTPDLSTKLDDPKDPLNQHAEQIRKLAAEYQVPLVDSLAAIKMETARGMALKNLMAQVNHPNAAGHQLVVTELLNGFNPPSQHRDGFNLSHADQGIG
jgi:acyl-CoA thioesterase I